MQITYREFVKRAGGILYDVHEQAPSLSRSKNAGCIVYNISANFNGINFAEFFLFAVRVI